jgi:hypothetical protein
LVISKIVFILPTQFINKKMLILFKDIAAIFDGFYFNLLLFINCTPEKIAVPICSQQELISKQKSRKDNRKTGTNANKSMQRVKLHDMVGNILKGIIICTAVTDNGRFSMPVKS